MKGLSKTVSMVLLGTLVLCAPVFAQADKPESSAARDLLIKSQVETAVSMLRAIQAKCQRGEMSMEKAKELGAGLLRELGYGNDGYFWADTLEGVNVVLQGRKDVEGRNRLQDSDLNGYGYVKAFLTTAQAGGGYVEYLFPKPGQSKAQPKRSYESLRGRVSMGFCPNQINFNRNKVI